MALDRMLAFLAMPNAALMPALSSTGSRRGAGTMTLYDILVPVILAAAGTGSLILHINEKRYRARQKNRRNSK